MKRVFSLFLVCATAVALGDPEVQNLDASGGSVQPLGDASEPAATIPTYTYKVIKEIPHRASAWIEGISFDGDKIIESTGGSTAAGIQYLGGNLAEINAETGEVEKQTNFKDIYGEGSVEVGKEIYVLSWHQKQIKEFNEKTLHQDDVMKLPSGGTGEGWGATTDGEHLIYSDGSHSLTFLDPKTKKVVRKLSVTAAGKPLPSINELEWVEGEVWCNMWRTYKIARIDPASGHVKSWVDISGIHPPTRDGGANGIAYQKSTKKLVVTGKLWDKMYEIEVVPQAQA